MSPLDLRPIPGLPGYLVSQDAQVFSARRREMHQITQYTDRCGYLRVTLRDENGRKIHRLVHRLVYSAFVGPLTEGLVCCHNDGNRQNNSPDNLRLDTQKGNLSDTIAHGTRLYGDRHPNAKYSEELVKQVLARLDNSRGSVTRLAKELNVKPTFIYDIRYGRRRTSERAAP
jgi:hypothetical protein